MTNPRKIQNDDEDKLTKIIELLTEIKSLYEKAHTYSPYWKER